MEKKNIVILGGGLSGLSLGYYFSKSEKYSVTVIEKESFVGGVCGSFKNDEFMLDFGPHKFYSVLDGITDEMKEVMGDEFLKVKKLNRIFLKGHLLEYPLKMTNLLNVLGLGLFLKLGFGYAGATLKSMFNFSKPKSYEEYMTRIFGGPAYELVFKSLAQKVWGEPHRLHSDMAKARVPSSNGFEIILKLLGVKKETEKTNAEYFYYPQNGFGSIGQRLKQKIESCQGRVIPGATVQRILKDGKMIKGVEIKTEDGGLTIACDYFISTITFKDFSRLISEENSEANRIVDKLSFRDVVLVYLQVDKERVLEDQWIFFPEKEFIFSRISEQKLMSPNVGPKDKTIICCDFTYGKNSDIVNMYDQEIIDECIKGLKKAGILTREDVRASFVRRIEDVYPVYDLKYSQKLSDVMQYFKGSVDNLLFSGRLGMYNYNNADHCIDMSRFIFNKFEQGLEAREIWDLLEKHVCEYKIVD